MNSPHLNVLASSRAALPVCPAGMFALPAQRAISLCARESGTLRLGRGRVWATFGEGARDASNGSVRAGDYFLDEGGQVRLAVGQKVVLEALPQAGMDLGREAIACFDWQRDGAQSKAQLTSELGAALVQVGVAAQRLVRALLRTGPSARPTDDLVCSASC
jgi:Protein of unknown function (DUF2917)